MSIAFKRQMFKVSEQENSIAGSSVIKSGMGKGGGIGCRWEKTAVWESEIVED
jgi:hypothetical protein